MRYLFVGRKGVTLIELVISLALLLIALGGVISVQGQIDKSQRISRLRGEENDLLNYLFTRTDCPNTFDASTRTSCTSKTAGSNHYVAVKDRDNAVFLESSANSKIGPAYTVRAKCTDESGFFGILFEAKRSALGEGLDELFTGSANTWRDINRGVPLACP
jgi:prepilin-type N-terminal cleavage/methylation domain-containing protein